MKTNDSIKVPQAANVVMHLLEDAGFECFVVGGFLRDSLLGRPTSDIDLATSATPEDVMRSLSHYLVIPTGLRHGTVTVLTDDESLEITTFREDGSYSDYRRPDEVHFARTIEEDLARRDFTINALAWNEKRGLIDPWGGLTDLQKGVIRAVGDPDQRFHEDALRIFRGLRLSAELSFCLDVETSKAMHSHRQLLRFIAPERLQVELNRLIVGNNALMVMRDYVDVLAVVIPELTRLAGVPFLGSAVLGVLDGTPASADAPPLNHEEMGASGEMVALDDGQMGTGGVQLQCVGEMVSRGDLAESSAPSSSGQFRSWQQIGESACLIESIEISDASGAASSQDRQDSRHFPVPTLLDVALLRMSFVREDISTHQHRTQVRHRQPRAQQQSLHQVRYQCRPQDLPRHRPQAQHRQLQARYRCRPQVRYQQPRAQQQSLHQVRYQRRPQARHRQHQARHRKHQVQYRHRRQLPHQYQFCCNKDRKLMFCEKKDDALRRQQDLCNNAKSLTSRHIALLLAALFCDLDNVAEVLKRLRYDCATQDRVKKLIKFQGEDLLPEMRVVWRALHSYGREVFCDGLTLRIAHERAHCKCDGFISDSVLVDDASKSHCGFVNRARGTCGNRFLSADEKSCGLLEMAAVAQIADELIREGRLLTLRDLAVDGYDLLDRGYEGREIGCMLEMLLEKVCVEGLSNTREGLLSFIDNIDDEPTTSSSF